MGPARTGPTPKTPKRRLTGSKPGEVNARDVQVSFLESAGWSGLIGSILEGMELLGQQLQDSTPWMALSFPLEVVAVVVIVSFVLIFIPKLWLQKRSDNKPDRRRL